MSYKKYYTITLKKILNIYYIIIFISYQVLSRFLHYENCNMRIRSCICSFEFAYRRSISSNREHIYDTLSGAELRKQKNKKYRNYREANARKSEFSRTTRIADKTRFKSDR